MDFNFSDDYMNALCRFDRMYARDGGHRYYEACPICGEPHWISTHKTDSAGNKVADDLSITVGFCQCRKCEEVRHRAPEVVDWVLAVLNFQRNVTPATPARQGGEEGKG